MVPSLVLGTCLLAPAAPVPADTVPTPTGPAPQVAYLKADPGGEVWVTGFTLLKQKFNQTVVSVVNGKQEVKTVEREQVVQQHFRRQLTEVGGKITTAGGTELSPAAVARRLADGGVVLVSADGKPVEKGWLRAVRPETLVIAAEPLAGAAILAPNAAVPSTAAPRLVLLAADAEGRLNVAVGSTAGGGVVYDEQIVGRAGLVVLNGQVIQQRGGYTPNAPVGVRNRPLDEVAFEAYELDGRVVPKDEARRRLKAGGLAVVAGDARLPDAEYLKLFRGDLLVLVSADLALPPAANARLTTAAKRPVPANAALPVAPVPAPIQPAVLPANGLRVAPVQRALPAPAPAQLPNAPAPRPAPEKQ